MPTVDCQTQRATIYVTSMYCCSQSQLEVYKFVLCVDITISCHRVIYTSHWAWRYYNRRH